MIGHEIKEIVVLASVGALLKLYTKVFFIIRSQRLLVLGIRQKSKRFWICITLNVYAIPQRIV